MSDELAAVLQRIREMIAAEPSSSPATSDDILAAMAELAASLNDARAEIARLDAKIESGFQAMSARLDQQPATANPPIRSGTTAAPVISSPEQAPKP